MATVGIPDHAGRWTKIQPWICLLASALALGLALFSRPIVSVGWWFEFGINTCGWISFVFGAGFRWWGSLQLASAPRGALVTSGPYSVCRNPMQIGNLLLGLSLALFFGSATFALGLAVGGFVCLSLLVAAEEDRLAGAYGPGYRAYCRRVSRFWIRPGLFQSPETLYADATLLFSELRRTVIWIWIPVVGKTLAQCRGELWWPHWLSLP